MYICVCKAVTDKQIKSAIADGRCSRRQLNQCLGVGGVCGKCIPYANKMLDESRKDVPMMSLVA